MQRLNLLIALLYCVNISAQISGSAFAGARSAGLSHATVALTHAFSGLHNQATTAFLEKSVGAVSYQNRYFLNQLNLGHGSIAWVKNWGTLSVNGTFFGGELYQQSKFGLAYARKFGPYLAMGLQLNYENSYVSEGRNLGAATFEFGIIARPTDALKIGFHIYNPNRSTFDEQTEQRLPALGRLGLVFTFSDKALLALEARSNLVYNERYAGAFEYSILERLSIRAGLAFQNDLMASTGLGFKFGELQANLAYEYGFILGNNLVYGLQYPF